MAGWDLKSRAMIMKIENTRYECSIREKCKFRDLGNNQKVG